MLAMNTDLAVVINGVRYIPATAAEPVALRAVVMTKADANLPAFVATGPSSIAVRAGTIIGVGAARGSFADETNIEIHGELIAGRDYFIFAAGEGEKLIASLASSMPTGNVLGGFHYAPGGNANGNRTGGDCTSAINPFSIWDARYRPACADPRGMALQTNPDGSRWWCDIYLLGTEPAKDGTSRHGAEIADGSNCPFRSLGGRYDKLDYTTAKEIMEQHGKQLLSYDDFRVAAFGVTEKTVADDEPETTGLDAPRTSETGIMQATGNMWVWGHDGDPNEPRACIFGGSWLSGGSAGSRQARLDYWAGSSNDNIGARGRSDHLQPA